MLQQSKGPTKGRPNSEGVIKWHSQNQLLDLLLDNGTKDDNINNTVNNNKGAGREVLSPASSPRTSINNITFRKLNAPSPSLPTVIRSTTATSTSRTINHNLHQRTPSSFSSIPPTLEERSRREVLSPALPPKSVGSATDNNSINNGNNRDSWLSSRARHRRSQARGSKESNNSSNSSTTNYNFNYFNNEDGDASSYLPSTSHSPTRSHSTHLQPSSPITDHGSHQRPSTRQKSVPKIEVPSRKDNPSYFPPLSLKRTSAQSLISDNLSDISDVDTMLNYNPLISSTSTPKLPQVQRSVWNDGGRHDPHNALILPQVNDDSPPVSPSPSASPPPSPPSHFGLLIQQAPSPTPVFLSRNPLPSPLPSPSPSPLVSPTPSSPAPTSTPAPSSAPATTLKSSQPWSTPIPSDSMDESAALSLAVLQQGHGTVSASLQHRATLLRTASHLLARNGGFPLGVPVAVEYLVTCDDAASLVDVAKASFDIGDDGRDDGREEEGEGRGGYARQEVDGGNYEGVAAWLNAMPLMMVMMTTTTTVKAGGPRKEDQNDCSSSPNVHYVLVGLRVVSIVVSVLEQWIETAIGIARSLGYDAIPDELREQCYKYNHSCKALLPLIEGIERKGRVGVVANEVHQLVASFLEKFQYFQQ